MQTTQHDPCPFQWGDRIDHKLFGFGTVDGDPVASVGMNPKTYRTEPRGWMVPVKWDDPERTATQVASVALNLVTRPDAKGSAYWNNEYQKHLKSIQVARTATDTALKNAFRPHKGNGLEALQRALEEEQDCMETLKAFLKDDANGEHA